MLFRDCCKDGKLNSINSFTYITLNVTLQSRADYDLNISVLILTIETIVLVCNLMEFNQCRYSISLLIYDNAIHSKR